MSKVVVDLFSEHAAWSLPAASLATLRAAFGSGWEVCAVESETPVGAASHRLVDAGLLCRHVRVDGERLEQRSTATLVDGHKSHFSV